MGRQWTTLVKEGKQAVKSNWKLGDLALEVETGHRDHSLQEYADEIGVEYDTLRDYRYVAEAWPTAERSATVGWSIHRVFAGQPDRVDLIKHEHTAASARALVKGRGVLDGDELEAAPIEDSWLQRAIEELRPVFEERTKEVLPDKIRINYGWPQSKGKGETDAIGEAYSGRATADGIPHIYISPKLSDPTRILDVLAHELIHVADDCKHAHGEPFKRMMRRLDLAGEPKATHAGPFLQGQLEEMGKQLGKPPHGAVIPDKRLRPSSKSKTVKAVCVDCQYMDQEGNGVIATLTQRVARIIQENGPWQCVCGKPMEVIYT